jgi:hypothetical protein
LEPIGPFFLSGNGPYFSGDIKQMLQQLTVELLRYQAVKETIIFPEVGKLLDDRQRAELFPSLGYFLWHCPGLSKQEL